MIDEKQSTKNIPTIIFKLVSLPFYIVFNIASFIFFGMSLRKLMDPDHIKHWPVIIIRTIIIVNLLYFLPYILNNANTIMYKLSTLTTTDILNILNMILVGTLAIGALSIILFKLFV